LHFTTQKLPDIYERARGKETNEDIIEEHKQAPEGKKENNRTNPTSACAME
jgi:hypothetical protein